MLNSVKRIHGGLGKNLKLYWYALHDDRTPRSAKLLLAAAALYAVWPVDILPDWLPLVGLLDDVAVVSGLMALAKRHIPQEVVDDYEARHARPRGWRRLVPRRRAKVRRVRVDDDWE